LSVAETEVSMEQHTLHYRNMSLISSCDKFHSYNEATIIKT